MRLLAKKNAAFRHPRKTILEPINRAEHQSVGGVDRAHQSIQAAIRALRLNVRTRIGEDVVPGHALFQWMLRHAAWSHNRFQQLRDNRTCAWREDGMTDSRNLSQVECDVSVIKRGHYRQRAGVLRPRACWCMSCHCCHCPHWSSRCC